MITHGLFPTPVSSFNLARELTDEESSFLLNQEEKPNAGNTTSLDRKLLENEKLASLREFVETSLSKYLKEIYSPKQDVKLRITQSWSNYTKPGQFIINTRILIRLLAACSTLRQTKIPTAATFIVTGKQIGRAHV